jgi:hypothetical protein
MEVLDDITRLRYEGKLPENMNIHLRNPLLLQYQQWKGKYHVPKSTDSALKWSPEDPFLIMPQVEYSSWQIIDKGKNTSKKDIKHEIPTMYVPATGSLPVATSQKHKLTDLEESSSKKPKIGSSIEISNQLSGLKWDANDWSCAYDSLFTIFYHIWVQKPCTWSRRFKALNNKYLTMLTAGFKQVMQNRQTFENVRDSIRHELNRLDPTMFPMGQVGTSVAALAREMLRVSEVVASSQLQCTKCQYEEPEIADLLGYVLCSDRYTTGSTSRWVKNLQQPQHGQCPECFSDMRQPIFYNVAPKLLVLEYPNRDIRTSYRLQIDTGDDDVILYLTGIVYLGGFHFTSRLFSQTGAIWYHDGQATGSHCIVDDQLPLHATNLSKCRGRELSLAIYSQ